MTALELVVFLLAVLGAAFVGLLIDSALRRRDKDE